MTHRAMQEDILLSGRRIQGMLQSATNVARLWLVLVLACLSGCGKTTDLAAGRHAKSVKALIDLGAEVRDVEDEVTRDRGTYVILFREHFAPDGKVHGDVLKLIREIQSLFLGVLNSSVSDDAMPDLAVLPNLRVLNATNTRLSDRGVKLIAASRDLKLLKLNRTRITDDGLECLREMPSLRLLYVGDTDLSVSALPHLARLPQLEAIKLSALPITDAAMQSLSEMPQLRFLALDGTAVTNTVLKHLDVLPKLAYLDVQHTAVTHEAITEFRQRHPQCFIKE